MACIRETFRSDLLLFIYDLFVLPRFDVSGVHPKVKVPGTFTEIPYDKKSVEELVRFFIWFAFFRFKVSQSILHIVSCSICNSTTAVKHMSPVFQHGTAP